MCLLCIKSIIQHNEQATYPYQTLQSDWRPHSEWQCSLTCWSDRSSRRCTASSHLQIGSHNLDGCSLQQCKERFAVDWESRYPEWTARLARIHSSPASPWHWLAYPLRKSQTITHSISSTCAWNRTVFRCYESLPIFIPTMFEMSASHQRGNNQRSNCPFWGLYRE